MTISTQISRVICDGTLPSRLWSSEFRHQLTAILHRHLVEVKKTGSPDPVHQQMQAQHHDFFCGLMQISIQMLLPQLGLLQVRDHLDQMIVRLPGITHCHQLRCNLDHPVAISRFSPVSHTSTTMVRSLCTKFWSDRKGPLS